MYEPQRKFFAHKDLLGAVLVTSIFAMGGVLMMRSDLLPWPMADKVGGMFLVLGALAWWDWMITSYEINQEELIIRSGLSERRVALCNIEDIQRHPRSLRLKCQRLRGSRWLTVSPVNQRAFAERLWEKCPWLRQK